MEWFIAPSEGRRPTALGRATHRHAPPRTTRGTGSPDNSTCALDAASDRPRRQLARSARSARQFGDERRLRVTTLRHRRLPLPRPQRVSSSHRRRSVVAGRRRAGDVGLPRASSRPPRDVLETSSVPRARPAAHRREATLDRRGKRGPDTNLRCLGHAHREALPRGVAWRGVASSRMSPERGLAPR